MSERDDRKLRIRPVNEAIIRVFEANKEMDRAAYAAIELARLVERIGATAASPAAPPRATPTPSTPLEICEHQIALLHDFKKEMKQHQTDLSHLWGKVEELEKVLEDLESARSEYDAAVTACNAQWKIFTDGLATSAEETEKKVAAHDLAQVAEETNRRIVSNAETSLTHLKETAKKLVLRCETDVATLRKRTAEEARMALEQSPRDESPPVVPRDDLQNALRGMIHQAEEICTSVGNDWEKTQPKIRNYSERLASKPHTKTSITNDEQGDVENGTVASNKRQREGDTAMSAPSRDDDHLPANRARIPPVASPPVTTKVRGKISTFFGLLSPSVSEPTLSHAAADDEGAPVPNVIDEASSVGTTAAGRTPPGGHASASNGKATGDAEGN